MAPNVDVVDIAADDRHTGETTPSRVMDERIPVGFLTIKRYDVGGLYNRSISLRFQVR